MKSSQRRAFTLIEMIATVALLAAFAVLSADLFHSSMVLQRQATQDQSTLAQFDSAIGQLRQDVWAAAKIENAGTGRIRLTAGDKTATLWDFADAGVLLRVHVGAGTQVQRWQPMPPGMTLAVQGPLVLVRVPQKAAPAETLTLVSQVQLVGGGR